MMRYRVQECRRAFMSRLPNAPQLIRLRLQVERDARDIKKLPGHTLARASPAQGRRSIDYFDYSRRAMLLRLMRDSPKKAAAMYFNTGRRLIGRYYYYLIDIEFLLSAFEEALPERFDYFLFAPAAQCTP